MLLMEENKKKTQNNAILGEATVMLATEKLY